MNSKPILETFEDVPKIFLSLSYAFSKFFLSQRVGRRQVSFSKIK